MCLIALAFETNPDLRLAISSNRDEFYDRPTAAMDWWSSDSILAGRDLQAGGTWLGLSRRGRFAAITNFRGHFGPEKPLSRGHLVRDFLTSTAAAADFAAAVSRQSNRHAGFNLILFDGGSLHYVNNYEQTCYALGPGVYALSNYQLDCRWPKVEYARKQLSHNLATPMNAQDRLADLTTLLSERQPYPERLLPDTGVPHRWEKILSSPFIVSEGYGTRACTGVLISNRGEVAVMEKAYNDGVLQTSQQFDFQL